MHEIGYYGLAPPISALVKGKDLEKSRFSDSLLHEGLDSLTLV